MIDMSDKPSQAIGNYKTGNEKKLEKGSDVASSSLLTQLRGNEPLIHALPFAHNDLAGTPTPGSAVTDPLLCEDQQ